METKPGESREWREAGSRSRGPLVRGVCYRNSARAVGVHGHAAVPIADATCERPHAGRARATDRMREARDKWGAESILPYCYGGSNGLLTQDTGDATFFRRLGASRLARTVCAAPTGAANGALKGNLHIKAADGTPMANAFLSMGHMLGMETDHFGDSTGELSLTQAAPATVA